MPRESPVFGAIDQGTTSTRAVRLEADGRLSVLLQRSHSVRRPAPGRVEMDAAELLACVADCAAALDGVAALGLANQGESCLAWDARTKTPLSPVLSWQDLRGGPLLARLMAEGRGAEIAARGGLPLDPYFSASKLAWLCAENADVRRTRDAGHLRIGTTDSFFLDALAGVFATDAATASRTGLTTHATGGWDAELCAAFGVPIEALPPIRANTAGFGAIGGVPVAASIVDQQAALYGHGCRDPGEAKFTLGTGGFALALRDPGVPLPPGTGLIPTVAWDLGDGPVPALDGGVPDVGTVVDWTVRAGLAPSPAALGADGRFRAEAGLTALPVFSGLGTPDWDRGAQPIILGMTAATSALDIATAVLEGAAYLSARVLRAMAPFLPPGRPVRVDGGVAANDHFLQVLADLSGMDVLRVAQSERTALGAALLAARAAGHAPEVPDRDDGIPFAPRPVAAEVTARLERTLALSRSTRGTADPQAPHI